MTAPEMTPTQWEALRCAAGDHSSSGRRHYRITTVTWQALERRGLVKRGTDLLWYVTDAGRAVLAEVAGGAR